MLCISIVLVLALGAVAQDLCEVTMSERCVVPTRNLTVPFPTLEAAELSSRCLAVCGDEVCCELAMCGSAQSAD